MARPGPSKNSSLPRRPDIGNAALNLCEASDIELADLGYHGRIAWQIVLDADDFITVRGHEVCQERILGVLDGVAVIDDRDRQPDHASVGLHLLIATHGDVDRDETIVA